MLNPFKELPQDQSLRWLIRVLTITTDRPIIALMPLYPNIEMLDSYSIYQ